MDLCGLVVVVEMMVQLRQYKTKLQFRMRSRPKKIGGEIEEDKYLFVVLVVQEPERAQS